MPSSTVHTFTDPDRYTATIRQGTSEITLTARGDFTAQLTRIDLHSLWMQRFSESVPRIKHTAGWGGRSIIVFPTRPGLRQSWSGVNLQPTDVIRFKPGSSYYQHSAGASSYGSMSLPLAEMDTLDAAMAGGAISTPRDTLIFSPPPSAIAKLQRLHAAAGLLAETFPEVIANAEAARGLEQALIEAMVGCLAVVEAGEDRASKRRHELIMRRFHFLLHDRPDHPFYIPEICNAIGISERTLRSCCQEQLGMSPKEFLIRRRMHMAQRKLRGGRVGVTKVTDIAMQFGFWDLGRFAGVYENYSVNYRPARSRGPLSKMIFLVPPDSDGGPRRRSGWISHRLSRREPWHDAMFTCPRNVAYALNRDATMVRQDFGDIRPRNSAVPIAFASLNNERKRSSSLTA